MENSRGQHEQSVVLSQIFIGILALFTVFLLTNGKAFGGCKALNNTALSVNFPDYPIWKIIGGQMQQCGNVNLAYGFDATSVVPATKNSDSKLGALVGLSNASFYRLLSQKKLRPLDDLVKKYGDRLDERQFVRYNGKIYALAVAANMRALVVHQELFEQEKITIPKTYGDMLQAADRLKGSKLYAHSMSLAFKSGWNLTQEFIEQMLASGSNLVDERNLPLIGGELGEAALNRMKQFSDFLPKNYLEAGPSQVLDDLLKFRAPMSILWISNIGPLDNPAVSRVSGKMSILPAPAIKAGGKPASSVWWDGYGIPVSASKEQAEAAFLTVLEGLDAEMLALNQDKAFWLIKNARANRLTKNLYDELDKGMLIYPDSQALNLLRRALNSHISDFMEGKTTATQALALAETDYLRTARELGLVGS